MSDCPVCYGMEGYTLHTCGRVSEADIVEQEAENARLKHTVKDCDDMYDAVLKILGGDDV